MSTYAELLEEDLKRQLEFTNVKAYHDLGYTGKGITILNTEDADATHGKMTNKAIVSYAPDATIINCWISNRIKNNVFIETPTIVVDGVTYDFEDAIDKFNIKVVTTSYAGSEPDVLLDYFKRVQKEKGIIMLCAAGNNTGEAGLFSAKDTTITVSASKLYEDGTVKIRYYGDLGEIDFSFFMGTGLGTSAASPTLAALIVLLLQRYGDFNQEECVQILASLSMDLGVKGYDDYYGWGLPILPLTNTLPKLEELRVGEVVENMIFTDVEDTRWSKDAIDTCVEEGLLQGFEDGTFRPTESVTREQMAVILTRLLER